MVVVAVVVAARRGSKHSERLGRFYIGVLIIYRINYFSDQLCMSTLLTVVKSSNLAKNAQKFVVQKRVSWPFICQNSVDYSHLTGLKNRLGVVSFGIGVVNCGACDFLS